MYIKFLPSEYVLRYKNSKVVKEGARKSLFEFGIRNSECGISGGKGQKGLNPNSLSLALFG